MLKSEYKQKMAESNWKYNQDKLRWTDMNRECIWNIAPCVTSRVTRGNAWQKAKNKQKSEMKQAA